MTFDDALEQVVREGAIRYWRVSGGWYVAYRIKDGVLQARGMHAIRGTWKLADKLVSSKTYREPDGWYEVDAMHQAAEPISLESARGNPGYFTGMERQCHTCKKYRPISMYSRNMVPEGRYRTWECDKCAGEREQEMEAYQRRDKEHAGDYLQRAGHSSRPPVEGEI